MRYIISTPLRLIQRGLGIVFMAILGLSAIAIGTFVLVGCTAALILVAAWLLLGLIFMLVGQGINSLISVVDPTHTPDAKLPTNVMKNVLLEVSGKRVH
jgi:hypothetical protein